MASAYHHHMPASARTPAENRPNGAVITRSMRVAEILSILPESSTLLAEYGLHCVGCHYNAYETLEEGAENHGFDAGDLDDLVSDLNLLLSERGDRARVIHLTPEGAAALKKILVAEKKDGWGLRVGLDEQGAFCLETAESAEEGELTFLEPHHQGIALFASELTLRGIGGATIDFRDGRFKLDLPDAPKGGCACATGGACRCG
jgi:hybrid cluster-associated redox disulfide protein